MLRNGDLARRIRDDALDGDDVEPDDLREGARRGHRRTTIRFARRDGEFTAMELFELIATTDVRDGVRCISGRARADATAPTGSCRSRCRPARRTTRARRSPRRRASGRRSIGRNVMIKVPGTAEGAKAVRQLIGERRQRQHHAAVRDRRVQARDRRVHGGTRGSRRGGQGHRRTSIRWRASSSAASTPRSTSGSTPRRRDAAGQAQALDGTARARRRSPTRSSRTSCFRREIASPRWKALAGTGRDRAAAAVGEHEHEESGLPRRDVRRGAHRSRHGEHDAAADDRGVPRSREREANGGRRRRRGAARRSTRSSRTASRCDDVTDKLLVDGIGELPEVVRRRCSPACRRRRRRSGRSWSRVD